MPLTANPTGIPSAQALGTPRVSRRLNWSSGASYPSPISGRRLASAVFNGKIYAAQTGSGTIPVSVYDPATNTWSAAASITGADFTYALSAAAINGKIYWLGLDASTATNVSVVEYDPVAGTIHPSVSGESPWPDGDAPYPSITSGPRPRVAATANFAWQTFNALYKGPDENGNIEVLRLAPENFWDYCNTNISLIQGSVVSTPHFLYYVDGFTSSARTTVSGGIHRYDPFTDTEFSIGTDPTPCHSPLVAADGKLLYVLGGSTTLASSGAVASVRIFDLEAHTWTTDTALPAALYDGEAHIIGGSIYVVGGKNGSGTELFGVSKSLVQAPVVPTPPVGGPVNDNFANATALTGTSGGVTFNLVSATQEWNEPSEVFMFTGLVADAVHSDWFTWTAPADGSLTLSTASTPSPQYDLMVSYWVAGSSLEDARFVDYYQAVGSPLNWTIDVDAGITYYIRISLHTGQTARTDGVLSYSSAAFTRPSNDDFANAAVLSGMTGTGEVVDTINASHEWSEPALSGSGADPMGVWYKWVAPASGQAIFTTKNTSPAWDRQIQAFTGVDLYSLTQVVAATGTTASAEWSATAGTTYYVRIAQNGTADDRSDGVLDWGVFLRPDNDDWANAETLSGGTGSVTVNTMLATEEASEPASPNASSPMNSVWYAWTPTSNCGAYFTTNLTTGTSWDSVIDVFTGGTLATLTLVVSDDESGELDPQVNAPLAAWIATAGTTYYIRVTPWSPGNTRTDATLTWSTSAVPTAVPPAPTLLLGAEVDNGTRTAAPLTVDNYGDAVWFNVYNAADNSLIWVRALVASTARPTWDDITQAGTYNLYAKAENLFGEGPASAPVVVTIPAGSDPAGPPPDQTTTADIYITLSDDTVDVAPDFIVGTVGNAVEGAVVNFFIDSSGTPFVNSTADDDGAIFNIAMLIPGGVGAGDHTVTVDDGSTTGTATFHVLRDPTADDTTPDDIAPSGPTSPRWVLNDPVIPENFIFPINPETMNSPFGERNLTVDYTTSGNGQPHVWEGNRAPANWSFSGELLEQWQHDELARWAQKLRRVYLTDHFGRKWIVVLTNFDAKPKRGLDLPWRHEYTMSALVIGRKS